MTQKQRLLKWLQLFLVLLLLLLIVSILLAIDIYAYSFESDPAPADAAIVLGTEAWNAQPSPVFRERINHAIKLYETGRVKYLIFTGGAGKNEPVAEAIVARDYAIQNGVRATDTLYEARSTTTFENLCNSRDIIETEHLGRILVVSDPLHMLRSVTIARDLGIDAHPSPTPTSRYVGLRTKLAFLVDEVWMYAGYLVRRVFENPEQRCPRGAGRGADEPMGELQGYRVSSFPKGTPSGRKFQVAGCQLTVRDSSRFQVAGYMFQATGNRWS